MTDAILLFASGLLAAAVVLSDPVMLTRLAVAISFGALVGVYFWAVLPYHREQEELLAKVSLDIFD